MNKKQTTEKYIRVSDATQTVMDKPDMTEDEKLSIARRLQAIPAADVVPVRRGTWIKADEQPYFRKHYHAKVCSECGKRKDGKWLYCPYCGSKNQDGGQDE